jgi:surface carbohydrate biosynthesis protein
VAAERGFRVVMGSRALLHHRVSSLPRGVYLAKSLRRLSDRMFAILDRLGHDIVAWDEEALVHLPDPNFYYGRRLSPKTLRLTSALFAWGPENEALFRGYPGYHGTPIYVTGNPRTDMMRPELRGYYAEEIEQIHKRHDRLCWYTNFG